MTAPNAAPAHRRPRPSFYALLVSGPFIVLLVLLIWSPGSLGWVPFEGSVVSIGIYLAAVLFVWPVIVAWLYLRAVERP